MSKTRELIEAVSEIETASLHPEALRAVRLLLLDHIGVAASGSRSDSAVVFRSTNRWFDSEVPLTLPVIGTATSSPAVRAAMANAVAAHATEYDDVHNASSSHPGVVIFPAVFAAGVLAGADEDAIVRGVVIGYEVMCRIGRAANPPSHYARHFHPTGTAGALGAAAGAAVVLGLDLDATVSAIGIAGSMASGSMEFLADGAWTKRLHPAFAVRNGVEAALLAGDGYVGTRDGIAGSRGFLNAYSDAPNVGELLAGWGDRPLEVSATSIKAHTCCRYNQGAIDAVMALRASHSLAPDDVQAITIGVPSVAVDIVAEPMSLKRRPTSVVDAQFSLPYGVAVALRFGRAGTAEYADEMIEQPQTAAIMDRVSYQIDPAIDAVYPGEWHAWAEITTTGGTKLRADIDEPKGDPGNPLTDEELGHKFSSLASEVMSEDALQAVMSSALAFGQPGTLQSLNSALAP